MNYKILKSFGIQYHYTSFCGDGCCSFPDWGWYYGNPGDDFVVDTDEWGFWFIQGLGNENECFDKAYIYLIDVKELELDEKLVLDKETKL